jgi:hypothetical protein
MWPRELRGSGHTVIRKVIARQGSVKSLSVGTIRARCQKASVEAARQHCQVFVGQDRLSKVVGWPPSTSQKYDHSRLSGMVQRVEKESHLERVFRTGKESSLADTFATQSVDSEAGSNYSCKDPDSSDCNIRLVLPEGYHEKTSCT